MQKDSILENDKIRLKKIQQIKKFYINSSKVYLSVIKETGVVAYYECRLKEYNENLKFFEDEERILFERIQDKVWASFKERNEENKESVLKDNGIFLKGSNVILTQEEKDEYSVMLDNLHKDGELELERDEYKLYLDKLTREGEERTTVPLASTTDTRKNRLLEDIKEAYNEELN